MLRAVILEYPPHLLPARDEHDVQDEEDEADHAVDEVEEHTLRETGQLREKERQVEEESEAEREGRDDRDGDMDDRKPRAGFFFAPAVAPDAHRAAAAFRRREAPPSPSRPKTKAP